MAQRGQRINVTLFDFSPRNFSSTPPGGATVSHLSPSPTDVASNASLVAQGRDPASARDSAHTGSHVTPRCAPGDLYATVSESAASDVTDEVVTSWEICRSWSRRSLVFTSRRHVISIVLHVDEARPTTTTRHDTRSKFIVMYEGLLTCPLLSLTRNSRSARSGVQMIESFIHRLSACPLNEPQMALCSQRHKTKRSSRRLSPSSLYILRN